MFFLFFFSFYMTSVWVMLLLHFWSFWCHFVVLNILLIDIFFVLISDDWAEWTCQEGVEFLHALQQVRKVRGMYSGPWTRRSSDVFLHRPRSSAALLYPPCTKLSQPSVAIWRAATPLQGKITNRTVLCDVIACVMMICFAWSSSDWFC